MLFNKREKNWKREKGQRNDVKLFLDKAKILHNRHFIVNDIDVEIDMLIIATKGIFCVEIKNWGENAEFTESGYLKSERKNQPVRYVTKNIGKGIVVVTSVLAFIIATDDGYLINDFYI